MPSDLLIRRDEAALLDTLLAAGAVIKGAKSIRCPFHDDTHPSASVYCAEDGAYRYRCHGCGFGGDIFDVRAKAEGRDASDLLREYVEAEEQARVNRERPQAAKPLDELTQGASAVYQYTNPDTGKVELVACRYDKPSGKSFSQIRPEGDGFVRGGLKANPIYNRGRVRTADRVVVVEGEKCVHALHDVGVVATTSPGGAGAAGKADWTPLAGKNVVIWPDNDENGTKYGRAAVKILRGLTPPPTVSWVDVQGMGLPTKGDAADFLAPYASESLDMRQMLVADAIKDASPLTAATGLRAKLQRIINGKEQNIQWPWWMLSECSQSLLPGTVTLLCGDPGSAKSFMLLQACLHWYGEGRKIALFELEESTEYHLYRALAQLLGNADIFTNRKARAMGDSLLAQYDTQADLLEGFGERISDAPDDIVTLTELAQWVRLKAEDGCEIVAIDPVTMAEQGKEPWVADHKFVVEVKNVARQTGCRVILVTHPRQAGQRHHGASRMDIVAGGRAYSRFPQCVLFLDHYMEPKAFRWQCKDKYGMTTEGVSRITRSLHITKARNGAGAGKALAMNWIGHELRFSEHGMITGKADESEVDA